MAPATHIGAAHPVQIGGGAGQSPQNEEDDAEQEGGDVIEDKIVNDAKAWARSLAELRGRNADWAEAAVTQSESIPSTEALELNVIDYLADDLVDLLDMIDSLEVQTQTGSVSLRTANAPVQAVEMWWGEKVLSILSDPNLAFLLLMLGFYGILFEFYTPGWGIAGTTGAICLAVLPINYAGLVLIVLAVGLFVAEAFFPSFGMLTIGGAVCLILGGIMLVDSPIPVMRVSLAVIIPVAIGSGIVAFFLAARAVQSFRLPIQTGAEAMAGQRGRASGSFTARDGGYAGTVLVHGELWRAESDHEIVDQQAVTVQQCIGLTLIVKGIGGSRTENPAVNQDR
jgi:membrane-bound serine protease (ClpP class)